MALYSHLDVSTGVDLVNCVSRGTSSLSIQVIALNENCMIAQTAHPDISFPFALQLHTFTNVKPVDSKKLKKKKINWHVVSQQCTAVSHISSPQNYIKYNYLRNYIYIRTYPQVWVPGSLYVLCPVDIAQLTQAETIPSWWIHISIHGHNWTCGWHLESLPNLNIHFKVCNWAPVFWSCNKQQATSGQKGCIITDKSYFKGKPRFPFCSSVLTRVIRYWGLKSNFISNRPCRKMSVWIQINTLICYNSNNQTWLIELL